MTPLITCVKSLCIEAESKYFEYNFILSPASTQYDSSGMKCKNRTYLTTWWCFAQNNCSKQSVVWYVVCMSPVAGTRKRSHVICGTIFTLTSLVKTFIWHIHKYIDNLTFGHHKSSLFQLLAHCSSFLQQFTYFYPHTHIPFSIVTSESTKNNKGS